MRRLTAASLVVSIAASFGFAQTGVPIADLKAAFLFNFAKFTEWPGLSPRDDIVYCVVGDDSVASALSKTVRGQQIAGRRLQVRTRVNASAWAACHVLFVSESHREHTAASLAVLRTAPVLTVSDANGFADAEGISELEVESGRMRFAINVPAAERAGLRLSSRLLSLARVVRSDLVR